MITVRCPSCQKTHQAPESILGRRVQCKDCGTAFLVEHPAPTGPDRSAKAPQEEEIDRLATATAKPMAGPASDEPGATQVSPFTTGPKRPFGLVWIVFYWIIGGLGCVVAGYVLAVAAGASGAAVGGARGIFDSSDLRELSRAGGLLSALLDFVALLLVHYGLLLMVACYGLWTFRRWGLSLARGLAIASVVLNVIILIITLVTRAGIVSGVTGLVISAGILVYLWGSDNLRGRMQRYLGSFGGVSGSFGVDRQIP